MIQMTATVNACVKATTITILCKFKKVEERMSLLRRERPERYYLHQRSKGNIMSKIKFTLDNKNQAWQLEKLATRTHKQVGQIALIFLSLSKLSNNDKLAIFYSFDVIVFIVVVAYFVFHSTCDHLPYP